VADWLDQPVALDAAAAAVIAAGMKAVALADGQMHHRELALIKAFEAQIPDGDRSAASEWTAEVQRTYLRSLAMVGLADGKMSPEEEAVIRELASGQGIPIAEVDRVILEVKRRFLRVFSGVEIFRDSVESVARDLGLGPEEIEGMRRDRG
jgi:hypothetical protein